MRKEPAFPMPSILESDFHCSQQKYLRPWVKKGLWRKRDFGEKRDFGKKGLLGKSNNFKK
jgi:hypothetical protein